MPVGAILKMLFLQQIHLNLSEPSYLLPSWSLSFCLLLLCESRLRSKRPKRREKVRTRATAAAAAATAVAAAPNSQTDRAIGIRSLLRVRSSRADEKGCRIHKGQVGQVRTGGSRDISAETGRHRYVQKSQRIGCVIPRCKLKCCITQPILQLF